MAGWGALLSAALAWAAPPALDEPPGTFESRLVERADRGRWTEETHVFPSASPGRHFAPNNEVWAHWRAPKGGGRRPAVLLLPVMAAPNVWIEERFMRPLLDRGLAVLWIELPFQFHRRPHPSMPSGQAFLARRPERLAANFRQAVLDSRRALTWLAARPEADPARLGLVGISLGAIVGSVVYSVDARPRYAALILGGADMPSLVVRGSMTGPTAGRMGLTEEALRRAWRGLDPSDYAASNAAKPALLINVRSDTIVPRENGLKLARAFPAARQEWLPLGHYSAMLHILWVPRHVAREVEAALRGPTR